MKGRVFVLSYLIKTLTSVVIQVSVFFGVPTDIGDHWPDTRLGGVQGDRSSALG